MRVLLKRGRLTVVWEWPKQKMAWLLWNWQLQGFFSCRVWRVGPITVWLDDKL